LLQTYKNKYATKKQAQNWPTFHIKASPLSRSFKPFNQLLEHKWPSEQAHNSAITHSILHDQTH